MQERRKIQRGRTFLGGQVAFNNRGSTLDCLVRNMCQSGAKIVFESAVTVPREFDLMIQQRGESRRARVAWQNGMEAGVSFPDSDRQVVVSIETARRLKKLETERDGLARRVAQLSEPM